MLKIELNNYKKIKKLLSSQKELSSYLDIVDNYLYVEAPDLSILSMGLLKLSKKVIKNKKYKQSEKDILIMELIRLTHVFIDCQEFILNTEYLKAVEPISKEIN